MARIEPDQARAWRERWELLARREIADLRTTSVVRKLRQLEALFASRDLFPDNGGATREAAVLSERWHRIRNAPRA